MKRFLTLVIGIAILLGAFYWWSNTTPVPVATTSDRIAVALGGVEVSSMIADTPAERAQGLSGVALLKENEGMLFIFPADDRLGFWMKDMLISIDMIWLSSDKQVVHIEERVSPDSYPKTFRPDTPARYVLEVPAGWAERHGVKVGDTAEW